jgi:uncharacterized protein YjbJ (UPF0337 family)
MVDKEHIKGAADKIKGSVKEAAGKLTGNDKLVAEGQADKAAGTARESVGDIKDAGRKVAGSIKPILWVLSERGTLDDPIDLIIDVDDPIRIDILRAADQFAQSELTPIALIHIEVNGVPAGSRLDLTDGINDAAPFDRSGCTDAYNLISGIAPLCRQPGSAILGLLDFGDSHVR